MNYAQALVWAASYERAINNSMVKGNDDASVLLRELGKYCDTTNSYYTDEEVATAATNLQTILGATTYPTPT